MIFPIWQPFASSSHRLAGKCGELLNEKATHTGTLDPMAEGVLVLLTGEDRLVKGSLSDWKKTYSFSIVWGVETDSGDKLGMIKNVDLAQATPQEFPIQKLKNLCANFPTEYLQTVPIFSAARYAGKSGFDWARENKNVPEKNTTVEIHTLENNGTIQISCEEILNEHQRLVSKVDGDFRQTAILENW